MAERGAPQSGQVAPPNMSISITVTTIFKDGTLYKGGTGGWVKVRRGRTMI